MVPYRYIAIREKVLQEVLPGIDEREAQGCFSFATVMCAGRTYRVSGIVTNREGDGAELIRCHRERCGKSEEAHAMMKTDLAGGRFPSGKFGANAAWWQIMILSYNLHAAMRLLALPGSLKKKRLKGIRFALIDVAGRVVEHGRQLFVRLAGNHSAFEWLTGMRAAIGRLAVSGA